jgi:glycosyltransferase involved in cell wall biosynthesis
MLTSAIYRQFLLREVFHADEKSAGIFIDPFWGNVVHKGDTEIVCYDCIDDISLYVGYASRERFAEYETRLLGMADVIISTSRKLQEQLQRKTSKHVRRIPNGVDVDWFQQHSSAAVPDDLQRIAGPVVGYVGYLAGWTDYELIHEVAALLPEVSFVFIGPLEHEERAGQLQREKNIYWLGKKPYEEIPACIQRFNVCIIPFVAGGIAETTNPVKIFEYFALGKPVVSTPLNELQSYVDEGVMTFAATPASFAEALRKALVEENNGLASQRKAIAGKNSWHSHAQSFVDAFNQAAKK